MTTPELTDLGDARVLNELSGSIPLTGTLRATVSLEWRRDSRPPEGLSNGDFNLRTGLSVDL